ncbi:TPA: hypothetical protein EYP66_18805 [Candidatus Poribacteria bacterium]|nr:hypothetical protein [Candidatus Poribacteria bacterium]
MLRRSTLLALTFVVILTSTNIFAAIWYEQNFDKLKDGDLAGQDEWKTAQGQASTIVQSKVFLGDKGKAMQFSNNQEVTKLRRS